MNTESSNELLLWIEEQLEARGFSFREPHLFGVTTDLDQRMVFFNDVCHRKQKRKWAYLGFSYDFLAHASPEEIGDMLDMIGISIDDQKAKD